MNSKILSFFNKIKDLFKFDSHRNIRINISKIKNDKNLYDYGEGYFYQSLSKINLSGLRNTKFRKDKLNLDKITNNKKILDVGTNAGFLLMEMNNNFHSALGIDYNCSLIKIANLVKNYLNINNIEFKCKNIYEFESRQKFDVILSLANHSTFDSGINNTIKYFDKIINLINDDGIIVFESHHPKYENLEKFNNHVAYLKKNFIQISEGEYLTNNFYDYGRKFVILKKI